MSHAERRRKSLDMLAEWVSEADWGGEGRTCAIVIASVTMCLFINYFIKIGEVGAFNVHFANRMTGIRYNSEICPICRSTLRIPTETNCGHLFCGSCIQAYWRTAEQALCSLSCPICRRQLTQLQLIDLENYYADINNVSPGGRVNDGLYDFLDSYNSMYNSNAPRYTPIPRLPWYRCILLISLTPINGPKLKICIAILVALFYLFFPNDILPEHVHGIFIGFIDDAAVLTLLAVYINSLYPFCNI